MKTIVYQGFEPCDIHILGPSFEEKKCPTLLYFSLSGQESLNLSPYNQPAVELASEDFRVISLTLPGHHEGQDKHEAMSYWANNLDELETFIKTLHTLVDHLFEKDFIESKSFGVAGLSRGGFLALHVLSHEKVKVALGIAPVTDLSYLSEFSEASLSNFFSLQTLFDKLYSKTLRLYIGNRDEKVGTHAAFNFVSSLANYAYDQRVRSPKIELMISPSTGLLGHGTLPHTFKEAASWVQKQIVH